MKQPKPRPQPKCVTPSSVKLAASGSDKNPSMTLGKKVLLFK